MVPDRVHALLDDVWRLLTRIVENPALARRSFGHVRVPGLTPVQHECLLALYVLGPSVVPDLAAVLRCSESSVRQGVARLRDYPLGHLAIETPVDNGAKRYELSERGRRVVEHAWPDQRVQRLLCAAEDARIVVELRRRSRVS